MYVFNKVITIKENTDTFKEHFKFRIPEQFDDKILKRINIHFSCGCKTLVHTRIRDKGGYIIPDSRISACDFIFGDNIVFQFNINKRVFAGDTLFVDARNMDDDTHTISVEFIFTIPNIKQ